MAAMSYSTLPDHGSASALAETLRAKAVPLASIVLVHLLVGYLAYSGTLKRVVQVALPAPLYVSMLTQPAKPQPAAAPIPKTVTLAQLPPPLIPPVPVINIAPPENAIRAPLPPASLERSAAAPAILASAAAAPPALPRTITSGVEYIHAPQPVYPQLSRRMGEQGKVILRILVNEKGLPDQVLVQTSSGSARLDEAGRQAALRALFKPYLEDGRAVAVFVIVPLNFQLAS